MGSNSVTYELRAVDHATPTVTRVGQTVISQQEAIAARENAAAARARQHEASVASAERQQRRFANAIEATTSATALSATAIIRMRGLLIGLAEGGVIGAVAALAGEFFTTHKNVEDLTKSIVDQAEKWDPYRAKIDEVRQSTVGLYNDQLALWKFQERDTEDRLIRQITRLEKARRHNEAAANDVRRPDWVRDSFKQAVLEQTIEIDKNTISLEAWNRMMALQPRTIEQVKKAVDEADPSLVNFYSVQDDLGRKIQDVNQEIRKSPLGVEALRLAFQDNITILAAYGRLKGAAAIQEEAGHSIIARTTELLGRGGIVMDIYMEGLRRGQSAQEASWSATARANSEEQKAITILTEAAKATAYLDGVQRDLGLTRAQLIVQAGVLSAATEETTMKALRQNEAMQAQQAFYQATNTAIYQAITGQAAFGTALKKAVADSLAGVAARALTEALYMTGIGIAASTPWGAAIYGPPPFWFKAAATMASVGVVSAAAARAAGAGSGERGGGSSGGSSIVSSIPSTARDITPPPISLHVTINSAVTDHHTLDRLSNELVDFLGRTLESRGGRAGNLRIETTRL